MLTQRQREILTYIERFLAQRGYSPSLADIADHLSIRSVSTVHKHLRNLEARGFIHRERGSRSIEVVTRRVRHDHEISLMGTLTGKPPIRAGTDSGHATLIIPPSMQQDRGRLFALRVRGDAFVPDGIHDGDYLICEERLDAVEGETVLAIADGDTMVCRRYVPDAALQVQGIVAGLIREW